MSASETNEKLRHFYNAFENALEYERHQSDRAPWAESGYSELMAEIGEALPETGLANNEVISELVNKASSGLNATTGGRFFGWVIGASHPAGVAADWLTSIWGQNAGNPQVAPAAAAFEEVVRQWLLALLDLPGECGVGLVTGATMANMTAMAAARSELLKRVGYDVESDGLFGAPEIRVILGDEAHATIYSGLSLLGLGRQRATSVGTDEQGRMDIDALTAVMHSSDVPTLVIAQAGHINTGAFDCFDEIVPLVRAHPNAWLHVDGAFGLWALAVPSLQPLVAGLRDADSWGTDGHKWLQIPYDCGFVIVRNAEAHRRPLQATASYLPICDEQRDPSHYVPELSRRARGFAAWAVFKALGRSGIVAMIEKHVAFAKHIERELHEVPGVHVVNDVVLNQVIVSADSEIETQALEEKLKDENHYLLAGAVYKGKRVLRISITGYPTSIDDIDGLVDSIRRIIS